MHPTRRHPPADDDPALSQVGRALVELDIDSILAGSPQAKGRVERLWGTFQDRLVVELRLAGVVDRADANAFLGEFLPRYNARFVVPACTGSTGGPCGPTRRAGLRGDGSCPGPQALRRSR